MANQKKKVYYIGQDNKVKTGTDFGDEKNNKFYKDEWSRNKGDMEDILANECNSYPYMPSHCLHD